jgi:hypothetical protein
LINFISVLFWRCTTFRVRTGDVQVCLGKKCGAKKGGGQCKKGARGLEKKSYPYLKKAAIHVEIIIITKHFY